jgi:zinc transporter, ZIP family
MRRLVSTSEVALLGGIAGMTILLGLPLGRLRNPAPRLRTFLNAATIGILVFLLFDVLAHANEPVESRLLDAVEGSASWLQFAALATVFGSGIVAGLLGRGGAVTLDWVSRPGRLPATRSVSGGC